ncbi:MAG: type IX secretion system membrane protein PorP/SprF, partial [bacterium]
LVFYNPAGLAGIANPQISCYYHKPFAGLSNVNLNSAAASFALPVYTKGVFGLGYIQFNAGDSADKLYQETSVSAALSYKVNSRLFTGFTLKQLSHRYIFDDRTFSLPDETFAGGCSASALTADTGLNVIFSRTLNFGISYQNFLAADVGIYDEDIVPPLLRFGSNFTKDKITIALDYDIRAQRWGDKTTISLGGEWRFSDILAFRTGYNKDEKSMGFGINTMVFGEDLLTFNYAYCIPSEITGAASHRLSISLRHGKKIGTE